VTVVSFVAHHSAVVVRSCWTWKSSRNLISAEKALTVTIPVRVESNPVKIGESVTAWGTTQRESQLANLERVRGSRPTNLDPLQVSATSEVGNRESPVDETEEDGGDDKCGKEGKDENERPSNTSERTRDHSDHIENFVVHRA